MKVLHPHLASRARSQRRFFQEARAAAAIHHNGVITVYDLDESVTAIAMEYHPGRLPGGSPAPGALAPAGCPEHGGAHRRVPWWRFTQRASCIAT